MYRALALALVLSWITPSPPLVAAQDASDLPAANAAFQKQDFEAAAKLYEAVVKSQPELGLGWFRLGYCLHAVGRYADASRAHERATKFPPFRPVALYNLGCAQSLLGNEDAAFDALERAVQAGFRNKVQFETDTDLDGIRADERFSKLLADIDELPAPRRAFDFWIGSWNVYNPQGALVGTNIISRRENGNIIHEQWTSANGGTGQSINYFDPSDRRWKQVWVDAGGTVVRYEGEFRDGAMRFTSGVSITSNGQVLQARSTFTPLPEGRVRQHIEHSRDEGKTWTTYFNGTYVRQGKTKDGDF